MIEFSRSYKVLDQVFASLGKAQQFALTQLLGVNDDEANLIVQKREQVMDILTTTDSSRPGGRKSHGAVRKSKKPSAAAINAELQDMKQ